MIDEPVPKVTLPSPGWNAPCPNSAAWLSPMAAAIGMPSARPGTLWVTPNRAPLSRTSGRLDLGTPKSAQSSSLQTLIVQIKKLTAGGIGCVARMHRAIRETMDQPRVDRAEPDVTV